MQPRAPEKKGEKRKKKKSDHFQQSSSRFQEECDSELLWSFLELSRPGPTLVVALALSAEDNSDFLQLQRGWKILCARLRPKRSTSELMTPRASVSFAPPYDLVDNLDETFQKRIYYNRCRYQRYVSVARYHLKI